MEKKERLVYLCLLKDKNNPKKINGGSFSTKMQTQTCRIFYFQYVFPTVKVNLHL